MTYTYAIMEVTRATFKEVKRLLISNGYDHAIEGEGGDTLDMHGIALHLAGSLTTNGYRVKCRNGKIHATDRFLSTARSRVTRLDKRGTPMACGPHTVSEPT